LSVTSDGGHYTITDDEIATNCGRYEDPAYPNTIGV